MKTLCLNGKVFSGKGGGAKFITLDWVKQQIEEKLGFVPFTGTLNIKLTEDSVKLRQLMDKANSTEITPAKDFCRGKCFKAFIIDLKCAVIIPEVAGYPENVVEIIAPANLRERFKLKDGDNVEVKVFL